jgi:hypothetical protein
MLFLKPLTCAEDFQPRAVDQQVDRPIGEGTALVSCDLRRKLCLRFGGEAVQP